MSKMIDGHALIMSLTDWWYSSFGQEETEESRAIKTVVDEVEKYVDGYPTYLEWIPVSERLPEKDGEYLVTVKKGYRQLGIWVGIENNWSEVIAWMPMPEPYKGGEK